MTQAREIGKEGLILLVLFALFLASFTARAQGEAASGADQLFPEAFPAEEAPEEQESSFLSKIKFSGYLKNETAYRYREPRAFTKIRNIVAVNALYSHSDKFRFNASGWAYYDLAYDLYDYDTIAGRLERNADEPLAFIVNLPREKDSPVIELREAYVDMFLGDADIRLGKQFIVWGVLEGVRITDEINPMDFRELILPELLDYRIPLWSAKADIYRENVSYQLVWIPDLRFHKPAPRGSEWELLQKVPNTRFPEQWDPANSEVGFRVSTNRWDTELTFSYLYTWDDFPVIFRRVRINSPVAPVFFPTYTRISMYGGTFIKQVKKAIVKGEVAYVTGKYFAIADQDDDGDGVLDNFGEIKRDHIRWGLGVDYNVMGFDVSPSVVQWIILDYDENIIQNELDTGINLFVRREFPQSSSVFQLLVIYLLDLDELYLKPKLTYRLTDKFQLGIGLDLFSGRSSQFGVAANNQALGNFAVREQRAQFLGNFHDNDRIFLEFKYAF